MNASKEILSAIAELRRAAESLEATFIAFLPKETPPAQAENKEWQPPYDDNYGPWTYFGAPYESRMGLGEELVKNLGNRRVRILTKELQAKRRISKASYPSFWKYTPNIIAYSVQNEESPWLPEPEEGFGPWVAFDGDAKSRPDIAANVKCQLLSRGEIEQKSWDPYIFAAEAVTWDWYDSDEKDHILYYRVKESPWYPAEEKFGPWIETYGNPITVPGEKRLQVLTRWQREDKKANILTTTTMQSVIEDHNNGVRFLRDIVAYRLVL